MKQVIGHTKAKEKIMNNLSIQSWLICGKRGIGKATFAKSFAKWFLVKETSTEVLDLYLIDSDSIGVEKIREMSDFLHLSPIQSEYKVAIIDSLEAMTNNAQNAILKILEEPPKNSKILIISHHPYDIKTTIRCRCFHLNLLQLTHEETKQVIASKCKFNDSIFDEAITLFPGTPGVIMYALNSGIYELHKYFYKLLRRPNDSTLIKKIINREINLELISYIIQTSILEKIKRGVGDVKALLIKWKKIDELFVASKRLCLNKKHVLTNVVNILIK